MNPPRSGGAPGGKLRLPWDDRIKSLLCVIVLSLLPFVVFWRITTLGQNPVAGDVITYYYPAQYFINQQIKQGVLPLWNDQMFSGTPLFATSSSLYAVNLLFLFLPAWVSIGYTLLLHLSLAGVFTYLYTRALGIGHKGAFVAGLTFMFCSFTVAHAGHLNIVRTVPWLPLILWAVERWRQRLERKYIGVGALATGFMLLGGHPQLPIYALAVVGAYILFFVVFADRPGRRWRFLAGSIGMVGLGLLIAGPLLWDLYQMSQFYERPTSAAYEYGVFSSFSLPPLGLLHLIFPRALIPVVDQTETMGYVGILPLALAALAAFQWRHRVKGLLLVIAGLALVLALGEYTPLNRLMFQVPIYNGFRAHARNLFEFDFVLAVLAGAGLHRLVTAQGAARQRLTRWAWGLAAALVVLGAAIPAVLAWGFPELLRPLLTGDGRAAFASPAIWLPWVMILASSAVLLAIACRPGRLLPVILAGALIVADLYFSFSAPQLTWLATQQSPSEVFAEASERLPGSVEFLKQDRSLHRIVSYAPDASTDPQEAYQLLLPNLNLLYGIDSADAYNGGKVAERYRTFSKGAFVGESYTAFIDPGLFRPEQREILNLLNVKYVLAPVQIDHPFWSPLSAKGVVFDGSPLPGLHLESGNLVSVALDAPAYPVTDLAVASALMGGGDLQDGDPVARIVVTDETGHTSAHLLLTGDHVAELTYDCDPGTMKHRKAALAYELPSDKPCPYQIYFARLRMSADPVTIRQIAVEYLRPSGLLLVHRLSLYNAQTSSSYPTSVTQGYLASLSQDPGYRLAYEDESVRIYENPAVLPRAFLAPEVRLVGSPEEADEAVHTGTLPDGSDFVPSALALVEAPIPAAPPAGGAITLRAYPVEPDYWTAVEWQDAQGGWHIVEGWQAPFDDQNQVAWGVGTDNLGKGPFRWAIYQGQGGPLVATSESFYLPASTGEAVGVQIPLLWAGGGQAGPTGQVGSRLEATVVSAEAGHIEVQTASDQNAFLVYSESFFPGWKAEVDGQPASVFRTDGVLLGIPVPAGEHTVVLAYRPPSLYLIWLSMLVTLASILWLVSLPVRRMLPGHARS
jgi:hypothetical protein